MSGISERPIRTRVLQGIVLIIFFTFVARLAYLQIFNDELVERSKGNYLRTIVDYPPRGEVFDRNGEYLVQSRVCYDIMVVWTALPKHFERATIDGRTREVAVIYDFDTVRFNSIIGLSEKRWNRAIRDARARGRVGSLVQRFVTPDEKFLIEEMNIPGVYAVPRSIRHYPLHVGGNLLGSLSEVSDRVIRNDDYYEQGDYYGSEGLEAAYESVLRGKKGRIIRDIYVGPASDSVIEKSVAGRSIVCTIDGRLQKFAESLMEGKVGAVVAIEPSTGEILAMVSSPTFDPEEMVGRGRGNKYIELLNNPRNPLFNRSVKAKYPPGSTFKVVNGLIGLQEGVLTERNAYPCHKGYQFGNRKLGCHEHASPLALKAAVAQSCNAYFCYVFRNLLENKRYGSIKNAFDNWRDYVTAFGFGRSLETDFAGEGRGSVPTRDYYDKVYKKHWNALTIISLSIGQGELGCTPLQLANLAATVANRGYYYIPHIVRSIEGEERLDERFYVRQQTGIDASHFETIIDGMWRGVNVEGTSRGACLPGLDVCGKTGTAQNPKGKDHSTFISFAPRNNPRIAIAAYVEHGGWGATAAVPIASLIEEYYLTDTITRPWLVDQVMNLNIDYSKVYANKKK